MAAPDNLPSPRGGHPGVMGPYRGRDGLWRAERFGGYVGARLAGGKPERPAEIAAEVPISSGGKELGAVLLLGPGGPDAGEYLHVAAVAALTEIAVAEARDE